MFFLLLLSTKHLYTSTYNNHKKQQCSLAVPTGLDPHQWQFLVSISRQDSLRPVTLESNRMFGVRFDQLRTSGLVSTHWGRITIKVRKEEDPQGILVYIPFICLKCHNFLMVIRYEDDMHITDEPGFIMLLYWVQRCLPANISQTATWLFNSSSKITPGSPK